MDRIGFIGLGNMGGNVAEAIASKGFKETVFDISTKACERFNGKAEIAENIIQVLENSDIIFLSLPSSKEVEPTVNAFIEHGVAGKIIVDTSTSYPISTKNLCEKVKAAGGNMVDLPLQGLPSEALEGKLQALFGGDEELFESLKPVVSAFSDNYANMGSIGNGHVTKLIFNFIGLSYVNIYALAFPLTEKMGLNNEQLFELMKLSGIGCGTMDFYVPKMINKTYDMAFALELAHKDLTYVKNMFEEYQVPAFALDGILDMLRTSIRDGKGKADYSACIATMYEFMNNK